MLLLSVDPGYFHFHFPLSWHFYLLAPSSHLVGKVARVGASKATFYFNHYSSNGLPIWVIMELRRRYCIKNGKSVRRRPSSLSTRFSRCASTDIVLIGNCSPRRKQKKTFFVKKNVTKKDKQEKQDDLVIWDWKLKTKLSTLLERAIATAKSANFAEWGSSVLVKSSVEKHWTIKVTVKTQSSSVVYESRICVRKFRLIRICFVVEIEFHLWELCSSFQRTMDVMG